MSALVLDAGALIAVERRARRIWALLDEARQRGTEVVVPTTALAQAWRGGPRSAPLSMLLEASRVDALDEERAKEVGIRLGERNGSDVADAHVVCCAIAADAPVATSDPDDVAALDDAAGDIATIAL